MGTNRGRMSRNAERTMPHQVITAQGSYETQMYLLKSGSADVHITNHKGGKHCIVTITSGQCFGAVLSSLTCSPLLSRGVVEGLQAEPAEAVTLRCYS